MTPTYPRLQIEVSNSETFGSKFTKVSLTTLLPNAAFLDDNTNFLDLFKTAIVSVQSKEDPW